MKIYYGFHLGSLLFCFTALPMQQNDQNFAAIIQRLNSLEQQQTPTYQFRVQADSKIIELGEKTLTLGDKALTIFTPATVARSFAGFYCCYCAAQILRENCTNENNYYKNILVASSLMLCGMGLLSKSFFGIF